MQMLMRRCAVTAIAVMLALLMVPLAPRQAQAQPASLETSETVAAEAVGAEGFDQGEDEAVSTPDAADESAAFESSEFFASADPATTYYDGVYTGTGKGRNGDIVVSVTIADGRIAAVEEVSQKETASYWQQVTGLFAKITEAQGTDVDSVSGATLSSDGIKAAVNDALSKAQQLFESGSGTADDPYVIATASQLANFATSVDGGTNYAGQFVKLSADIDLSGIASWNPIGTEANGSASSQTIFAGDFDGAGHAITGLTINLTDLSSNHNIGLFSVLQKGARVHDVNVTGASIEATSSAIVRAGLIAGDTVSGTNGDYAQPHAAIESCMAEGSVSINTSSNVFAGGVLGRAMISTVIANCATDVNIATWGTDGWSTCYAAGIVGMAGNNTAIVNCISRGNNDATAPLGSSNLGAGIVGMASGKIYNVAATGNQTVGQNGSDKSWLGMIAGQLTTAAGSYTEENTLRGYAYYANDATLTLNTYANLNAEPASTAVDARAAGMGTPRDTDFEAQANIVKGMPKADMAGDAFAKQMNDNLDSVAPLLEAAGLGDLALRTWIVEDGKVAPSGEAWVSNDVMFVSGTGAADDPYVIATANGLALFAESVDEGTNYAGQYVALGADIDLSGIANWNPIGTEAGVANAAAPTTQTFFAGDFDGAGHTISGLTIELAGQAAELNVGLFSSLQNTAKVHDLNLTGVNVSVTGSSVIRAGGIAGDAVSGTNGDYSKSHVTIDSCSVTGSVSVDTSEPALAFAGGIVGRQNISAVVSNSWTDVDATAYSRGGNHSGYAGGIFGTTGNAAVVVNCATFGDIKGASPRSTNFGGMAGGMGGMLAGRMWNVASSGDVTIGNAGSPHQWIGVLTGEITTSGMTKSGSTYVYPDTGALRGYAYYNSDATLTIEKYNSGSGALESTSTIDARANGTGTLNNDTVFESQTDIVKGVSAAEMASEAFASTMNGNLRAITDLAKAFGVADLSLNTWTLADGKVIPAGEAWVDARPDASIFEGGTGTAEDPYQIKTAEQLRAFAASLSDTVDYTGLFVEVVADIDISDETWTPVGDSEYAFNGDFDGAGHMISGLTMGTEQEPLALDQGAIYVGLFSVLEKDATVHDVNLSGVSINVTYPRSVYVGGIAGYMGGTSGSSRTGAVIDGCSVEGAISATVEKGNTFVGGIAGMQYKGALINSRTDVDASCIVTTGDAIAETGGLVALNNRGLIANCYTLGDVYGSASRDNGDEGMASISALVGVNAGDLANCYSAGGHQTAQFSLYAGAVSGWVTGIGKSYNCWYNGEAPMVVNAKSVSPVAPIGTLVPGGVSDEGMSYTGGVMDKLTAYTASDYSSIASGLNASFAEFPIDISLYGLEGDVFKTWAFDAAASEVTFGTGLSGATYVQPEAEIIPPFVPELHDGVWYGRDEAKTAVVAITVEGGEVVSTQVVSGEEGGEPFDEALAKAKEKSNYGDTSNYEAPDASVFDGGSGAAEDPYLVSTEAQLRYIATALNEDNAWEGVSFKQTADIALSDDEWLPIGWGIMAEIDNAGTQYCIYPFMGNYDGGDFTIDGLTIGTSEGDSADPRMSYAAGLFGIAIGEVGWNATPEEGERTVSIENVHLTNVDIKVASRYTNFVGGLAGAVQNGFHIDNCSVEGAVSSKSSDAIARAGGMAGSVLRGLVTNCWTDVEVYGHCDTLSIYVGGLYAMDNRVTTVNCYTLGNVTGDQTFSNRILAGGLTGQGGGYRFNCYVAGDVTATAPTSFAGAIDGNFAGISVSRKVYFNSDSKLTVAGEEAPAKAYGNIVVNDPESTEGIAKTADEIASAEFAELLNANVANTAEEIELIGRLSGTVTDLSTMIYYDGDGSDLHAWASDGAHAVFDVVKAKSIARIAGENYANETSAAISQAVFESSDVVILSRDDDFADALGATGLAGVLDAPIVLTDRHALSKAAADELVRLGAKQVYIIGGTGAMSEQLEADLQEQCGIADVTRLWGENSYDTSLSCAQEIVRQGGSPDTAIIAMSTNFQDALSMSPYAYKYGVPVILQTWGVTSDDRGFTDEAAAWLAGKNLLVAGGTGAISDASLEGCTVIERLWGETGYDTSAAIATWMVEGGFLNPETVVVTCGAQAPKGVDALAGAALAGKLSAPMLLVNANEEMEGANAVTIDGFLADNIANVRSIIVLGGTYVMPDTLYAQLEKMLGA